MGFFPNFAGVLLDAAGLDHGQTNTTFLTKWHANASSDCRNNPVDISRTAGGSSKCQQLTATRAAQTFSSPADAADAFAGQIHSGNFPHLLALLKSAEPPTTNTYADVSADLRKWGSASYAGYIAQHYGPLPVGIGAPQAHRGWSALQDSLNRKMRPSLQQASKSTDAALRHLAKARKVRL